MVCISSVCHDEVATEPSTTTPSDAWRDHHAAGSRAGWCAGCRCRTRSASDAQAADDQPDAEAEGERGQRRAAVDHRRWRPAIAASDTTKRHAQSRERGPQLGALPAEERADAERGEQRRADRHEGGVEEGRADRDLVAGQQVEEQRIERAQQHRGGQRAEQQVVQDQRALAADRLEQPAALQLRRAPGVEREAAAGDRRAGRPG